MVKVMGQRRIFDEDADWVPAKGRIFTMKKAGERSDRPKGPRG